MKPHLVFKEKLESLDRNIEGIVYVIDDGKSNRKEYYWSGIVRVITSSSKLIKCPLGYIDLCKFEWKFGSSYVTIGGEHLSYCSIENKIISASARNHLRNMKLFFPNYKAGVPSLFCFNQSKEFMEMVK